MPSVAGAICCAVLSTAAVAPVFAADEPETAAAQPLQEVTGTAVRRTQRVNDTAKPITLIDRQQIEVLNPATILDVLQTIPSLEIARSGGIEGQISLRGFNSNNYHSPLLIDGDRFKGRNTLEYLLLEPEDMERIGVIRGPAAEAFSSEAVGGVVNLTTFHPAPIDGPLRFTGGGSTFSYATVNNAFGAHGDAEGGGDWFGFRVAVNARHAGSYDTPEGVAHNSDYKDGCRRQHEPGLCAERWPRMAKRWTSTPSWKDRRKRLPINVPATGTATLELDAATKVVHYTVIYDGLSSPPIKVHLHGPKEEGMKAPTVLDEHSDHPTSPTTGTVTLADHQVDALRAGQLYVNVHTQNYPDGEIRGWLISGK
jgi:hypothetical protein